MFEVGADEMSLKRKFEALRNEPLDKFLSRTKTTATRTTSATITTTTTPATTSTPKITPATKTRSATTS